MAERGHDDPLCGPIVELDEAATVHGALFERARIDPETIAVRLGARTLTMIELARAAASLARRLRAAGVGPGDVVAVESTRTLLLPAALYGALAAGAAYMPLDPQTPAPRRARMLAATHAALELATTTTARPPGPERWLLDDGLFEDTDVDLELPQIDGRALAYVIFTSGTTGRPKGAMIEHRAVVNRLAWMQRAYALGPGDVILQKTPAVFDVSVWELFWAHRVGATLELLAAGLERFPTAIVEAIEAARVTVVHFIPSLLDLVLDHLERRDEAAKLASLRRVFASGETLTPATVARFARVLGPRGVALTNLYGPTEATVDVTYHDCDLDDPPARVPIGRPIDNIRLYVRAGDRPSPRGEIGSLFIAGIGVARGYADEPELSAAAFVPEPGRPGPEPGRPGERMYDSGDLVRVLPSGELEFLGRRDLQIKIAGVRVELEDIEQVIKAHAEIRECALICRRPSPTLVHLIAIVAVHAPVPAAALRAHAAAALPQAMQPHRYLVIDRLPVTASGKIDRRALADERWLDAHTRAAP